MMSGMFYGLVSIWAIILTASFIISLLLRFTSLTESAFSLATMVISFLAVFCGGLISAKQARERGWIIGAGTGLLYTLVVFLIQYLGFDQSLATEQYLYFGLYILAAAFGGIFGVNLTGRGRRA